MGLNRMMFISKHTTGGGTTGDNAFVITMGQQGYQYGYSRYNATIGEVEGNMQHDCKAVTLICTPNTGHPVLGGYFNEIQL